MTIQEQVLTELKEAVVILEKRFNATGELATDIQRMKAVIRAATPHQHGAGCVYTYPDCEYQEAQP